MAVCQGAGRSSRGSTGQVLGARGGHGEGLPARRKVALGALKPRPSERRGPMGAGARSPCLPVSGSADGGPPSSRPLSCPSRAEGQHREGGQGSVEREDRRAAPW